jgi:hypothetical protein
LWGRGGAAGGGVALLMLLLLLGWLLSLLHLQPMLLLIWICKALLLLPSTLLATRHCIQSGLGVVVCFYYACFYYGFAGLSLLFTCHVL